MSAYVYNHAGPRWVWGHAPHKVYFTIEGSEIASETIHDPKR